MINTAMYMYLVNTAGLEGSFLSVAMAVGLDLAIAKTLSPTIQINQSDSSGISD